MRTPSRSLATRDERKQRTRAELMGAALRLLEDRSFASLSLREVAREAGVVPTAFYRHFTNMEELGLALVEESFGALRGMLRAARGNAANFEHVIHDSVAILVRHVHANLPEFRFIVRERHGGVAAVRQAIRSEIRLLSTELATDLSRFPYLADWRTEDLQMMARLIVNAMVSTAEELVDAPPQGRQAEAEVIRATEHQLLLIALGVPHFRSG